MNHPRKILFIAESVTLAQVVRLNVLARALEGYEVHFASSSFDPLVFDGAPFTRHRIYSIDGDSVFRALDRGKRLYERPILERYVAEELELFERIEPDLVVGDFRLSLAVSAAVARVPQATLINAYFSPYAERDRWPVPDHPIVRLLGVPLAERYFPRAIPSVFAHFARPVNELRRLYGLPEIGSLLETLTYGDYTLYPDTPLLAPVRNAPRRHVYLGPVTWSPAVALPDFWNDMGRKRPCVYVTLGSSGDVRVLPIVLEGLAGLPVDVMLATARRNSNDLRLPPNVYAAEFLPGDLAARRAAFVVSNGGSATNYQALSQGTPVLGIPWNLDQYLGMACLERIGAAKSLRAGTLDAASVRQAARELLDSKAARAAAGRVAGDLSAWNATERFRRFVARVVPSQPTTSPVLSA